MKPGTNIYSVLFQFRTMSIKFVILLFRISWYFLHAPVSTIETGAILGWERKEEKSRQGAEVSTPSGHEF